MPVGNVLSRSTYFSERQLHPEVLYQEGPLVRGLFDDFAGGFAGAVAGAGFDSDQDRGRACLRGLQGGGELESVTWEYPVVVIGGDDKSRWILSAGFDVMQRRIFIDRGELVLVFRGAVIRGPRPTDSELLEPEHVHHADARQSSSPEFRPLGQSSTY